MEIVSSHGVSLYGLKAERNFCLLWVRHSSEILLSAFGGEAEALYSNHTWTPGVPGYQPGYSNCRPSLFRIEDSSKVTLANLWGDARVSGGSITKFGGVGTDPRYWNMVLWTDHDTDRGKRCEALGNLTHPMDKPVVFKISA